MIRQNKKCNHSYTPTFGGWKCVRCNAPMPINFGNASIYSQLKGQDKKIKRFIV